MGVAVLAKVLGARAPWDVYFASVVKLPEFIEILAPFIKDCEEKHGLTIHGTTQILYEYHLNIT